MKNFVRALIFISCGVVSVSSLNCYWCASTTQSQCDDKFESAGSLKIEENCQYCLKYKIKNDDVVVRNCTRKSSTSIEYKHGCATYHYGDYQYEECACNDDLCNGAQSEKSTTFGMAVLTCLSMYSLYKFC